MPQPSDSVLYVHAADAARKANQITDVPHVLIEALENLKLYQDLQVAVSKVASEPVAGAWLHAARATRSKFQQQAFDPAVPALRLQRMLDDACQEAQFHHQELTSALLMWIILGRDEDTSQTLRDLGIDRVALMRELAHTITPVAPPTSGGLTLPGSLADEETRKAAIAAEAVLTKVATPSDDVRFVGLRAVKRDQFLTTLGHSADSNDLVIVHGPRGSLIGLLGKILADLLQNGGPFPFQEAPLALYQHLHILDMEDVQFSAHQNPNIPAHLVLEQAKRRALASKAILMLDNIQVLRDPALFTDNVREQLRDQLTDRGDGMMFGIYREPAVNHAPVDVTLGLRNAITVDVPSYSAEETVSLLKSFYYPQWKAAGFVFADDAFASVIKLEPGAWIDKRRVALPLAAVMLAENVMVTGGNGEAMLLDVANAALRRLAALAVNERDAAQTHQDLAEALRQAGEAIKLRVASAKPGFWRAKQPFVMLDREGKLMLTNEHVVSQLLCPDNSEFDYPGYKPEGARDD